MKRGWWALALVAVGLAGLAFWDRQTPRPPVVFGLLNPTWPGVDNEERDELRRSGAAAVPGLLTAARQRSLTESAIWQKTLGLLPPSVTSRLPPIYNFAYRRRTAVWALGELGPVAVSAVPAIEAIRRSAPEEDMRVTAILALAKIQPGDAAVRADLLAAFTSSSQMFRFYAAQELGGLPDPAPEAVTTLIAALGDTNGEVRANAGWSLGQLGAVARPAVPKLRELLQDSYRHVPATAAYALVRLAPEYSTEAVDAIFGLIQRRADLVEVVARAFFLELGPEATNAVGRLREALLRPRPGISDENAAVALWRIERRASPEVLKALPKLASVPAIRALGELGPLAVEAAPRLRELVSIGNPSQQAAAAEALRKITGKAPPDH